MENRYKLIMSGKGLYKEVEISQQDRTITIGTSPDCTVRLRKELFFSPVELTLEKTGSGWTILCSDNLYFTVGDVRKLLTKQLNHGDELYVKYQESDTEVFSLSFVIDFDYEQKDYELALDISGRERIKIGGTSDADICVSSVYLNNDSMEIVRKDGKTYVVDNNSKYGVFVNGSKITKSKQINACDFISIVDFSFYYKDGTLYSPAYPSMKLNGINSEKVQTHSTHFKYPKFSRNTRIKHVIPENELEIQQAIQKPQKPKKNIIMSLIPSIVMLAMTVVLRGVMGGGGTFVIYSAVSMSMGVVMSIISFIQENKDYKKEYAERIERYNGYIADKEKTIQASRDNEIRVRNLIYESLGNSLSEADSFGKRLFEREVQDEDFLQVYLGKGTIESANQVKYPEQEFIDLDDPLATIPKDVSEKYRYIKDAPIVSDFKNSCGIGVVASPELIEQAIKNMTLDLGIRHFFNDVRLVYILNDELAAKLDWLRWLRNVENPKLGIRNIATDEESRNIILEDLYYILSEREALCSGDEGNKDITFDEYYVVFVTGASSIASHPMSKYFKNCEKYGFTFVFLEEYEEFIPQGCGEMIRLQSEKQGVAIKTADGDTVTSFAFPFVSDEVASEVAMKLGAVNVDEVTLEGELTKNITMFEMLGILSVEDIDLTERWKSSTVYKSLAAPLGVRRKGQTVYLDISDKGAAHGPHGLVAGTTGSGKSEILQTYILSMATLFHPYEVGFVIIDFKGGGMANQFKNLPHLIGTITNIDGREINRSLLSIKAELVKRQEMFSKAGVNHINDYIRLYKDGKVTQPMPHLIMIVDEFAELKADHPDFMKELISAARIGRTLGVHLILATQKPAGVVDAQIWSNSKFKLCLKVQTKEDSNEVIKTPLAAEIVEPGRAYFQVGNNEIFELFQSAYSGANVPEGNEAKDHTFAIYEKNLWGKKKLVYTNKKSGSGSSNISQLQAIVDYVDDYCVNQGIARLPGICLPSLKDKIFTSELSYENTSSEISVPIGIFDDPEQQRQGSVILEPSRDNIFIVGSPQMGKTVLLQTLLYGLIRKYTPQQVNMYLVDCGSMVLKLFEESKHVGGVVLSNEDEKCRNLFKLLNTTIVQRKKILSNSGVGNYAAYLEAGHTDLPLMVVIIDNMAAFKEYFPDEEEMITSLARESQGVGISLIVTAATSNALSYRTQANFGKKLVLNCIDPNEYGNVFGHCKETPKEVSGRGLVMLDKRIMEYQVAIVGNGGKEAERSQELREYIEKRNAECTGKALPIPMVPEVLKLADVAAETPGMFRSKGIVPIGMDFATVSYLSVNLNTLGALALLGDPDSKDRFLRTFIKSIANNIVFHGIEAVIVDDKNRKLEAFEGCGFVKEYTADTAEAVEMIDSFCETVEKKRENEEQFDRLTVLIINNLDALRRIYGDRRQCKALADAIKGAAELGVFILLGAVENQPVGFNSPDVLKAVKDQRQAILFASLAENKLYEISGRIKPDASFNNTMAYRFDGNVFTKIKLFE